MIVAVMDALEDRLRNKDRLTRAAIIYLNHRTLGILPDIYTMPAQDALTFFRIKGELDDWKPKKTGAPGEM